jgi:hypothetical protein
MAQKRVAQVLMWMPPLGVHIGSTKAEVDYRSDLAREPDAYSWYGHGSIWPSLRPTLSWFGWTLLTLLELRIISTGHGTLHAPNKVAVSGMSCFWLSQVTVVILTSEIDTKSSVQSQVPLNSSSQVALGFSFAGPLETAENSYTGAILRKEPTFESRARWI